MKKVILSVMAVVLVPGNGGVAARFGCAAPQVLLRPAAGNGRPHNAGARTAPAAGRRVRALRITLH
jgi:hypothetical protein